MRESQTFYGDISITRHGNDRYGREMFTVIALSSRFVLQSHLRR